MKLKLKLVSLLGLAMIVGGPVAAQAGPLIDGSFAIYATFRPVNSHTGATVGLNDATGIDFLTSGGGTGGGNGDFIVTSATDDFALTQLFPMGKIKDFTFEGTAGPGYPTPPLKNFELLFFNTLSFNLDNITVQDQNSSVLHLVGTGVFNWGSYDPTPGTFDFFGTSSGASLSFNVATQAAPVPEPSTLVLLGSGAVAAVGRFRRRRQTLSV